MTTSNLLQGRLQQPFPLYALDQLRLRFLFSMTTEHASNDGAAVIIQMAFETEIHTILDKLVYVPTMEVPLTAFNPVASRRHYSDVDFDMREHRYLIGPALEDFANVPNVPGPYVDFIRRYMGSDYPRYRMSAIAAMLCFAKAIL